MIYYGDLESWQDLLLSSFGNDIETTEKDFSGKIHCIGFSNGNGGVVFFMDDQYDVDCVKTLLQSSVLNSSFSHDIYYHNVFFDLPYILKKLFLFLQPKRVSQFAPFVYDTLILARYLMTTGYQDHVDPLGRTAFGLKYLSSFHEIDEEQEGYDDVVGELRIDYVPKHLVADYCYADCLNTFKLFAELKEIAITEGTWDYFVNYHHPHAYQNVFHMGLNAIPIDVKSLTESIDKLENLLETVKDEIFDETRRIFDFNSSRELSGIIFKNDALKSYDDKPLKKPFVTENGSVCLDTTTLKVLEGQCKNPELMTKIIFVLEAGHALGVMSRLHESVVWTQNGAKVFPKQSVSTSSARLRCTNPPIHGFGKKIFHHTSPDFLKKLDANLLDLSVRHFLAVDDNFSVLSSDAKSMDLVMLAELASIESWKEIFSWGADNHFEILRLGNPDLFNEIFRKWGGDQVGRIYGLGKKDGVPFLKVEKETFILSEDEYIKLKNFRAIAKETNLAIPYMLGANQLAQKIAEATGEEVHEDYAKEILRSYYMNFPEIRLFQDQIANDLYIKGFVRASSMGEEFGIRLHSNCYYRLNLSLQTQDIYEFIVKLDGHHFYVRSCGWVKHERLVNEGCLDDLNVISNLKYTLPTFGLFFEQIEEVIRLPDDIFAQKLIKASKTRYRKKNEDDLDESSNYIHKAAARSCMIDRFLKLNPSINPSMIESKTASSLLRFSYGFIPENLILFHRVTEGSGESYFKTFRSLNSEIKKVFPTFVQSVTAACVARVLSRVRGDIERRKLASYIFLSVHDSIDIMVHKDEESVMLELTDKERLKESFIPILWEGCDELAPHYS